MPRQLLQEVIADGACPLHLRLQLVRALSCNLLERDGNSSGSFSRPQPEAAEEQRRLECHSCTSAVSMSDLDHRCLIGVAGYLPYAEVLTLRTSSREHLQWAMQCTGSHKDGPGRRVHDRIRARLWMRRVADLTSGTKDESVFETRMRSLADEALRSRMKTEMQEALTHMEQQIRAFQADVDRRLEEQEQHVRQLVEERVQTELETILASEIVKVHNVIEERVRSRVSAIFKQELRDRIQDLHSKLEALAQENQVLRDAFAEANHRSRCAFWALHPWPFRISTSVALDSWALRRRLALSAVANDTERPK